MKTKLEELQSALDIVTTPELKAVITEEIAKEEKFNVVVGKFVEVTPCKSHAWYESNVGLIRKPIQ